MSNVRSHAIIISRRHEFLLLWRKSIFHKICRSSAGAFVVFAATPEYVSPVFKYVGLPIITRNYFQLIFYEWISWKSRLFFLFLAGTPIHGLTQKIYFPTSLFRSWKSKVSGLLRRITYCPAYLQTLSFMMFWGANMLDLLILSNWETWGFFVIAFWIIFKVLSNFVIL